MSETESTRLTPAEIGDKTFRIPLYQRPYAWESSQVEALLSDLHAAYSGSPEKQTPYYIGILSVAESEESKCYDLIDGQQRMTTLALIAKAAIKADCFAREWRKFIDKRIILWGRRAEQAFLESDGGLSSGHKMSRAFQIAKEFFDELNKKYEKNPKETNPEAFARYIYENASFFMAKAPSGYGIKDKNQQFVRMNHRGKQLENHEILKVKLISFIDDSNSRQEYFNQWKRMILCLTGKHSTFPHDDDLCLKCILKDPALTKTPDRAGGRDRSTDASIYTAIVGVPEFLLIALDRFVVTHPSLAKKGTKVSHVKEKLIDEFAKIFDLRNRSATSSQEREELIIDFLKKLHEQTMALESFFIFRSRDENRADYVFGRKENSAPLTGDEELYGYESDQTSANEKYKSHLQVLQSYLYVSTAPHHWLIPAFDWCEGKSNVSIPDFISKLEQIDDDAIATKREQRKLPDLEELSYGRSGSVRYWYYRLDYELWKLANDLSGLGNADPLIAGIWGTYRKAKSKPDILEQFRFRRCDSIEHIIPQNDPARTGTHANDVPIHHFGNLALISASRNSKFSNYFAAQKKTIIVGDSEPYTESLKMLHFLYNADALEPKTQVRGAEAERDLMYRVLCWAINKKAAPMVPSSSLS